MKNPLAGYTLTEIMIVVLIVGLLFALAIPNYRKYRDNTQQHACKVNLRSILSAVEEARLENDLEMLEEIGNDKKPDVLAKGTAGKNYKNKYLKELPSCPAGGDYTIAYDEDSDSYTITCSSGKAGHDISNDKL